MSCIFRLPNDEESFFVELCLNAVFECFDVLLWGFLVAGAVELDELEYVNFRFKFGLNGLDAAEIGLFFANIEYLESISIWRISIKKKFLQLNEQFTYRVCNDCVRKQCAKQFKEMWGGKTYIEIWHSIVVNVLVVMACDFVMSILQILLAGCL